MAKKEDALAHLMKDKTLKRVIKHIQLIKRPKSNDLYFSLLRAITGQQLSVKAAATIWNRFLALFKDGYPHAEQVLKLGDETLRAVGLSYQKASYIKNIARFSLQETLEYKRLRNLTDDELIDYLVQIKGVGRWTVEMLLMFTLKRPDVFPKDDLGIQNGIKQLYKLKSEKKTLLHEMETIAEAWRPHRTLACLYIWQYKDMKVMD